MIGRRGRVPTPPPRRAPRGGWPAVALLLTLLASAAAQTSSVGAVAGASGPALVARVTGVRTGDAGVDAWARLGRDAGLGALWRYTRVFGPLGNVIIEGGTGLLIPSGAPLPAFRATLGARGVVGPLAATLRVDAGTVSEEELDGTIAAEAARRVAGAERGAWDAGARLSVTYRVDRATTVAFEPRARWVDGATVAFASAALRRGDLGGEFDLWLGLEGGAFAEARSAALGVGTVWTRRRQPDSSLRVWLGTDGVSVLPGVEALLTSRTPSASLTLGVEWVPHRLDASPWRATFEASSPLPPPDGGTWRLRAAIAGGAAPHATATTGSGGITYALSLALERPWTGGREEPVREPSAP
jgi:hypothetical protein